jgi:hypothetical protein
MDGSFFGLIGNGTPSVSENLDVVSKDASKIYQTLYFSNTPDATDIHSAEGVQKIIECSLYNASYEVAFELKSNGQQTIAANRSLLNAVAAPLILPGCKPDIRQPTNLTTVEHFSYQALMEMLVFEALGSSSLAPVGGGGTVSVGVRSSLPASPALGLIT